ncbi:hypothetical protein L798_14217 [Zootermopsis nevadensis]|uniref:DUF4817 domain-containing protein n=1 Tax=Zootermopsis nevadensis TaxID=136037 RepID=A0A067RH30_ZOONE|nr:hypothetical protein L798_14217 [Zootermopsis nevadensis]
METWWRGTSAMCILVRTNESSHCVSVVATEIQQNFCTRFGRNAPIKHSVYEWHNSFTDTGLWIGRAGPVAWPPHSPDLTPADFSSYCDTLRITFTTHTPNDLRELRERIHLFELQHTSRSFCANISLHFVFHNSQAQQTDET